MEGAGILVTSNLFQFRDRLGVRFSCEIKLCVKADDGCAGITVEIKESGFNSNFLPVYSHPTAKASISKTRVTMPSVGTTSHWPRTELALLAISDLMPSAQIRRHAPRTMDADLISQYMFVLDEPVEGEEEEDKLLANQQGFCSPHWSLHSQSI